MPHVRDDDAQPTPHQRAPWSTPVVIVGAVLIVALLVALIPVLLIDWGILQPD